VPDRFASWNGTPTPAATVDFVGRMRTESGRRDYVPPSDRIAIFDADGTLLGE
jgi:hypothetical protein